MKSIFALFLFAALTLAGESPVAPSTNVPSNADRAYDLHVRQVRAGLPRGFALIEMPPFVIIGDGSPESVKGHAQRTIQWAVRLLKQDYFEKDPEEILDIWLFKDRESYEKHARDLFNEAPISPYGYYSPGRHALIMNIATGGGTLVHELVHPFMRANLPACPAWFNEGLASLYEQCTERDGHIHGLTNWRLSRLQADIRAERLPSFEALVEADAEFYSESRESRYAQARYLCYYLQEEGLLRTYYRELRANIKDDPTGYGTLKKVLGETNMEAFQERWEQFVLGLTFP